jgi:hypothetical protein
MVAQELTAECSGYLLLDRHHFAAVDHGVDPIGPTLQQHGARADQRERPGQRKRLCEMSESDVSAAPR